MKYENRFHFLTYVMSLISFVYSFINPNFQEWIRYCLLSISLLFVLLSIILYVLSHKYHKRKNIIIKGIELLRNAKSKVIIFGDDLSFIPSYYETINNLTKKRRIVEVYIPKETYDSRNSDLKNIINILQHMKVSLFTYSSNSKKLRCTILDPENSDVQIFTTNKECTNDNINKYKYTISNQQQNKNECELILICYKALTESNTVEAIPITCQ